MRTPKFLVNGSQSAVDGHVSESACKAHFSDSYHSSAEQEGPLIDGPGKGTCPLINAGPLPRLNYHIIAHKQVSPESCLNLVLRLAAINPRGVKQRKGRRKRTRRGGGDLDKDRDRWNLHLGHWWWVGGLQNIFSLMRIETITAYQLIDLLLGRRGSLL